MRRVTHKNEKMMNYSEKYKKKSGKPRKNAAPIWRRFWFTGLLTFSLVIASAGGSWWLISSGWFGKRVEWLEWAGISILSKVGFKLSQILVVGRSETSLNDLRKALGLSLGAPLLNYNLEKAKSRVEALPWVREASVKRM